MTNIRYPLIDALRGMSVLLVALYHLQLRIPFETTAILSSLPTEIWSFFFMSGDAGVRIFFVISGLLITTMTLKRWQHLSAISMRNFYLLRFARIAPPLILLLLVLTVLHFNQVEYYTINPISFSYTRVLFAALTFHLNWLQGQVGYLAGSWDVLWSLSIEGIFYLSFPVLCMLSSKRKTFFFLLIPFAIVGPFYRNHTSTNEIWSTFAYLSGMDSIAIGCITAFAIYDKKFSRAHLNIAGLLGILSMSFILLFKREDLFRPISRIQIDETLLSLATASVLVYCVQTSPIKWVLTLFKPLIAYGKLSYEIYLTHMFIVFLGLDLFKKMAPEDSNKFLIMLSVIVASGLLGFILEKFYSEPLNRLIRNTRLPPWRREDAQDESKSSY